MDTSIKAICLSNIEYHLLDYILLSAGLCLIADELAIKKALLKVAA
jgi:hypothetical protein